MDNGRQICDKEVRYLKKLFRFMMKEGSPCETQVVVVVEKTHITLFIPLASLILSVRKFSRPFLIF
jgi:hypothetical protein